MLNKEVSRVLNLIIRKLSLPGISLSLLLLALIAISIILFSEEIITGILQVTRP